jgi:hypothetical protein
MPEMLFPGKRAHNFFRFHSVSLPHCNSIPVAYSVVNVPDILARMSPDDLLQSMHTLWENMHPGSTRGRCQQVPARSH